MDLPDYTQTLNEIIAKKAAEWTTQDLEQIVAGLREQSEKWNAEQAAGSRKLVKSSKIPTASQSLKQAIKGIKL